MGDTQVSRWCDEAFDGEFLWASGIAPPLPMHHHPTWQVGLVRRGKLGFRIANWEDAVPARSVVLVAPRVPHRVAGEGVCEVEYAQVEFPERLVPHWWGDQPFSVVDDPSVLDAFDALLQASRSELPRSARLRCLTDFIEALHQKHIEAPASVHSDTLVRGVTARLEAVTDRPMRLADILDETGVSRSTLLRRFRRLLGATPHDYHLSVRLRAACDLIDAGHTLAEASVLAGFHDQSHFTRHARSVLAMGPGSWRRRRRVCE